MGQPLTCACIASNCSRHRDSRHVEGAAAVVAQTDSDARALAMVAAGLGSCLMPDSFEHPEVRMLRPEGVELPRRLGFEWVKGGGDGWLDRALDRLSSNYGPGAGRRQSRRPVNDGGRPARARSKRAAGLLRSYCGAARSARSAGPSPSTVCCNRAPRAPASSRRPGMTGRLRRINSAVGQFSRADRHRNQEEVGARAFHQPGRHFDRHSLRTASATVTSSNFFNYGEL